RLQVDRQRLLVDVELVEIPRVVVGLAGAQPAPGIAAPGVLDLDHLGAEPGEHLGAGRPRLELGEIDDLDALQEIEVLNGLAHSRLLPSVRMTIACALSRERPLSDTLAPLNRGGSHEVRHAQGYP